MKTFSFSVFSSLLVWSASLYSATEAEVKNLLVGTWTNTRECENYAGEPARSINSELTQLRIVSLEKDGVDVFAVDKDGKEHLKTSTDSTSVSKHIPVVAKSHSSIHYFLSKRAPNSGVVIRTSLDYREAEKDEEYVRETLVNSTFNFSFMDGGKKLFLQEGGTEVSTDIEAQSRTIPSLLPPPLATKLYRCWFTKK